MKTKVALLIFVALRFTACDYENPVDYNLINQSDKKLKVVFNQWGFNNGMSIRNDSTIFIAPKEKTTLAIRPIIGSAVWNPEYGNDTIWMFPKLLLYKNDTIPLNKNFRQASRWSFNKISRHHAELNLTITDNDL